MFIAHLLAIGAYVARRAPVYLVTIAPHNLTVREFFLSQRFLTDSALDRVVSTRLASSLCSVKPVHIAHLLATGAYVARRAHANYVTIAPHSLTVKEVLLSQLFLADIALDREA